MIRDNSYRTIFYSTLTALYYFVTLKLIFLTPMSDPFRPYIGGAMVFKHLAFYHIFIMILSVVIMSSTAASASQLVVSLEDLPSPLRGPGERVQHSAFQSPSSTPARSCDLLAIEFELFCLENEIKCHV